MNKLDQLPFEILSSIFYHLNSKDLYTCTLINKSLTIVAVPLLWRDLNIWSLTKTLSKITTIMATSPNRLGNHVQSISIFNDDLSDSDLLSFIPHVPFLRHLTLWRAPKLTDAGFRWVPYHCSRLTYLHLGHMKFTKLSMMALGQYCHDLQVVKVTQCNGSGDGDGDNDDETAFYVDFLTLIASCPLKEIELEPSLYQMTPEDVHRFASSVTLALYQYHHHRLTEIHLSLEASTTGPDDMTPFITICNTKGLDWPHLTHFFLHGCLSLDDSQAIQFLQRHPQLQYLEWFSSQHLTDRTLDAIPRSLPNIIGVGVYDTPGITAMGVCRMVKQCASLSSLKEGILCWGCGIYSTDKDFPKDLDSRFYSVGNGNFDKNELMWLDINAFMANNDRGG